MQSLSLNNGMMREKVHVPSSKSYANRALILSALLDNAPLLKNLPLASDVTILLEALNKVGLIIEKTDGDILITNTFPACEIKGVEIEVGEGGTTARFLAALLLLGKMPYQLILGQRLKARPWQEFIELVGSLGGKANLKDNVLSLQGPIQLPVELKIDCSKTTQFASAFDLISINAKTKVIPLYLSSSQSYWAMTEKMVKAMAGMESYSIPLDWSSASYSLAFGALNQKMDFPGLFPDELQADAKFFQILEQFQAVTLNENGIAVIPLDEHHSLKFDVSDALDLVPTLGYFLAHIEGLHELNGIQNLIHKESDRLGEIIKLLKVFDREAHTDGKSLFIKGDKNRIKEKRDLSLPNDHRMVMTGALFLIHHGGGTLAPVTAVEKSYPEFFDLIISS